MGCSPNMITGVIKKYGEGDVLSYVKAFVGEDLMTSKFKGIKDSIEKRFNDKGDLTPSNILQFDKIMSRVNKVEKDEVDEINASKPNIPQLDEISKKDPTTFMKTITSKFSKQIGKYKDELLHQKTDILDINKYIGRLGI